MTNEVLPCLKKEMKEVDYTYPPTNVDVAIVDAFNDGLLLASQKIREEADKLAQRFCMANIVLCRDDKLKMTCNVCKTLRGLVE